MRILAVDYGDKRIGLALSDPLGITAQGLDVLKNGPAVVGQIAELCKRHDVGKIVVGFPKNMNGTLGPRAQASRAFAYRLERATGLPVVLEDERLTTQAAERTLLAADLSRNKRRRVVDKMAAMLILQSYLQRGERK